MSAYQFHNPDGIYFVSFAVVEWVDVFTRPRYVEILLASLRHCQKEKGLLIYAWCVMSNHLHLIIARNSEPSLSDILRDFKKYTASQIIKSIQNELESRRNWMLWLFESAGAKNSNNTKYQFWRQDNQPEELRTPAFTKQKLDYLHNNPISAGWVERAEDYRYSSAKDYYIEQKGLLDIEFLSI